MLGQKLLGSAGRNGAVREVSQIACHDEMRLAFHCRSSLHRVLKVGEVQRTSLVSGEFGDGGNVRPGQNLVHLRQGLSPRPAALQEVVGRGESVPGDVCLCLQFITTVQYVLAGFNQSSPVLDDIEQKIGIEENAHARSQCTPNFSR